MPGVFRSRHQRGDHRQAGIQLLDGAQQEPVHGLLFGGDEALLPGADQLGLRRQIGHQLLQAPQQLLRRIGGQQPGVEIGAGALGQHIQRREAAVHLGGGKGAADQGAGGGVVPEDAAGKKLQQGLVCDEKPLQEGEGGDGLIQLIPDDGQNMGMGLDALHPANRLAEHAQRRAAARLAAVAAGGGDGELIFTVALFAHADVGGGIIAAIPVNILKSAALIHHKAELQAPLFQHPGHGPCALRAAGLLVAAEGEVNIPSGRKIRPDQSLCRFQHGHHDALAVHGAPAPDPALAAQPVKGAALGPAVAAGGHIQMPAEEHRVVFRALPGLPAKQQASVRLGGKLHDPGGVGIALLQKPAHLPQGARLAGDAGDADGHGKALGGPLRQGRIRLALVQRGGAPSAPAARGDGPQQRIEKHGRHGGKKDRIDQRAVAGVEITVEDLDAGPEIPKELIHLRFLL